MNTNFQPSLDLVLKSEGGYVDGNKIGDSGGVTNLGVTKAVWEAFLNCPCSPEEIKNLTPIMVIPLYKQKYWNAAGCDMLPKGVDYAVFDFAVNAGVRRSIYTLQEAVGTDPDGILGSITQALIKQLQPMDILDAFTERKKEYYKALNRPQFIKGWLSRVATVQTNAENMIQGAVKS